ncbi:MAG: hypothetical protein KKF98_12670 [Bacteroidetes bacterium]|nr:hypothetical protein [Bacteroidota bacterium]
MKTQFYERYKNYSKDELIKIILTPKDFQPEAVITARQIIAEKNWTSELNNRIEELNRKNLEDAELFEQEIKEKAEYYKNVLEFKHDNNSFQVRIADIPKFEAKLGAEGIQFFREDKNIGVQLDSYPTQTYFFKSEDVEEVDEITKKLGLITAPYADIKPFFKFEIKVLLIAVVVTVLLIILFK